MIDYNDLVDGAYYTRQNAKDEWYKVLSYNPENKKYMIRFKENGNEYEYSRANIVKNEVSDKTKMKKVTKTNNRIKKKVAKEDKYFNNNTVDFLQDEEVRLLAIDAATIATGICFSIDGKIIHYDYIYISDRTNDLTRRINYMKKEIVKIILKYNVNCIVIEDVIQKNMTATVALSKLAGALLDTFYEMGIDKVVKYNPCNWKSLANINSYKKNTSKYTENTREESKELTYLYVKDKIKIDIKKEFEDVPEEHKNKMVWQDLCDAIAINYTFYNNNINRIYSNNDFGQFVKN